MSGMQTNMFVHVYILPHHQSFPHSPSTYHTLPLQLHWMSPKSKPNTHSGTAQTLPDSCKHQGSNADQPKTKRTWCKTIESNNDDNENKSGDEQEAADGVEDEDNPPASGGSKQGCAMKKGPLEGMSGMIIVDHALISLFFFFFFVFTITYCFFTGKMPTISLETTWNSPYKGMPGTITTIMPLFLSFSVFLTTYLVFTGKLPMIGLAMTGNHPHKGTPGTIITIMLGYYN